MPRATSTPPIWRARCARGAPTSSCSAPGGAALREAGAEILVDQRELAVAGIVEVLEIVPAALRAARLLTRAARSRGARLALLVDAPDFHLPLARRLRRAGLPVLGYIGPNVMRWRRGRVHRVARHFDRLASIFPFEPALYAATRLRVDYVGHPLVEPLRRLRERLDRASARSLLGLCAEGPVLALFPGSRRNELAPHAAPLRRGGARAARRAPGRERGPRARAVAGRVRGEGTAPGALARRADRARRRGAAGSCCWRPTWRSPSPAL